MASPNSVLTELVTVALRNRQKKIFDNVGQHNALWKRVQTKNGIRTLEGGRTIVQSLDYDENQTFQRYSGYDVLNISPSEVFSSAEFNWMQAALHITISGREQRMVSGKEAMFNLVKERVLNAEKTFANAMNRDMYSAGTLPNQIGGLQLLVADTPTNSVGGIDGNVWQFWRNKVLKLSSPGSEWNLSGAQTVSKDNIRSLMSKMYIALTRGTDMPDFILCSPNWYEMYMESLAWQQRYSDVQSANAGFATLKYQSADVFFDQTRSEIDSSISIMPDNHMYFLNTDYIKLCVHRDANITSLEDKTSVNQDATVRPVIWMGNMTISNRARQGVMIA